MKKFRLVHLSSFFNQGVDLLFWLSFEGKRLNNLENFGGTFFIHGCYFGHNVEPDDISPAKETFGKSLIQYDGGRFQYTELSELQRRWIRNANGTFK